MFLWAKDVSVFETKEDFTYRMDVMTHSLDSINLFPQLQLSLPNGFVSKSGYGGTDRKYA